MESIVVHSSKKNYYNLLRWILFSAFLLLFPPLCGLFSIIGIAKKPQNWKIYLPIFNLFVFFLAYAYVPGTSGNDLLRYFNMVQECAKLSSLPQLLIYSPDGWDGCFVRNIIFWLIGKTGDVHLLPAISTTSVYWITGYISCSCASEHKQEKLIPIILIFQIIILPYSSVIDNVRNIWTFSLIILAAYFDIVKCKRNLGVILLYILPCFIHVSGIVFVIFRLCIPVIKHKVAKIIALFLSLMFPNVVNFAYAHISLFSFGGSIGDVIQTGIWKAWRYYNTPGGLDEYERALLASRSEPIFRLFEISFAVIILIFIFFYSKRDNEKLHRFNSFTFLICIITLACHIFITPHYWRFYCAVVINCSVVLIPMIQERRSLHKALQLLLCCLILYGIGGILMNFWNLTHAVDWSESISRFLTSNPYTIIFSLIGKLFL